VSRKLSTPVLIWSSENYRIVQVSEDNGFPDAGIYVLEKKWHTSAMGEAQWTACGGGVENELLLDLGRVLAVFNKKHYEKKKGP
jgi:hypothetical protein